MKDKGVEFEDLFVGQGSVAEKGSKVTIKYNGYLSKGDAFDKEATCTFTIGKREVIAGLEYGVEGMRAGGRRRLRVGPHLAYRDKGVPGVIPANALLIFEVELIEVENPSPTIKN